MLFRSPFSTSSAIPRKSTLSRFFDILHYGTVAVLAGGTVFLAANLVKVVSARRAHLKEAEKIALERQQQAAAAALASDNGSGGSAL